MSVPRPPINSTENPYFWHHIKCRITNKEECEGCDRYKSRYIEYPLTIQGIEHDRPDLENKRCGRLVKIRPCAKEYKEKTYLGIYLGEIPYSTYASFHEDTEKLTIGCMTNPGIFVPELKKIIFGMESWWGFIQKEEELKDITDETIENQWYVKALREMIPGMKEGSDEK